MHHSLHGAWQYLEGIPEIADRRFNHLYLHGNEHIKWLFQCSFNHHDSSSGISCHYSDAGWYLYYRIGNTQPFTRYRLGHGYFPVADLLRQHFLFRYFGSDRVILHYGDDYHQHLL